MNASSSNAPQTDSTNGQATPIPILDLGGQYRALKSEIDVAIQAVIDKSAFCLGFAVDAFEKAFAEYCGAKHCVGVNSGTSALHLALLAAGVGQGDEVITTPFTFIATSWAISYVGATPVFVDVDPETYTVDPEKVRAALTPKTKAILPVHLYGQMADMDPLMEIAREHGLTVVEDAAQAHGARYKDRPCGTISKAGCFSFYPTKNLGACGEGGAVVTDDEDIAESVRTLRNHAQAERHVYPRIGFNYRMEGLQGAVLGVKLRHLPDWTEARRRIAARYDAGLAGVAGVKTPIEAPYAKHVYHVYAVQLSDGAARDSLQKHLSAATIASGLHYPIPVHLQGAYKDLGHAAGDFPVAEKGAGSNLGLPLFPEMTDASIERVIHEVRTWAGEQGTHSHERTSS
jgi:dTDP-4-amino-4,6-dideoxygalactose transaminase